MRGIQCYVDLHSNSKVAFGAKDASETKRNCVFEEEMRSLK